MFQLKIGIHLPSLRAPLPGAFALAAELKADAVEIDARRSFRPAEMSNTALRQFRKSLADHRLQVCALSYQTRRGYNVADDLDARVAGTKAALQMAHSLGASVVINRVGRIPAEPGGREWNLLVEVLTDLGRHGQRVGAILAAQADNTDGEDLARLIAALPPGSIGVDLNPGLLAANGFSSLEVVELLAPQILHVRATDGVRDLSRAAGMQTPLGRGAVDFPALLGALEQRGYRGYLTVERDSADDPVLEIGRAIQYLRNL